MTLHVPGTRPPTPLQWGWPQSSSSLTPGTCAQLACIFEATARKPGNVHPEAPFADCSYLDFLSSAVAIGPVFEQAAERGVGALVLHGVRQTRQLVGVNTNLGILLLLAPLAKTAARAKRDLPLPLEPLRDCLSEVLSELTQHDAAAIYEAIRFAQPGGLGQVAEQDVQLPPSGNLVEVMALAADRDRVARQYVTGFAEVFEGCLPAIQDALQRHGHLEPAIIDAHLQGMARYPDSLIARKRGWPEAEESARRASAVLQAGWPEQAQAAREFQELDRWLRAAGNGRNPGTTADLITAGLYLALLSGIIGFPVRW